MRAGRPTFPSDAVIILNLGQRSSSRRGGVKGNFFCVALTNRILGNEGKERWTKEISRTVFNEVTASLRRR